MKFRQLKKIGKKHFGKNHFYCKIVSDEKEIPECIINADIPGYCIQDCKNNKMLIWKRY